MFFWKPVKLPDFQQTPWWKGTGVRASQDTGNQVVVSDEDILIVVDVQNDTLNEHSEYVVEPIAHFVSRWSNTGRTVILVSSARSSSKLDQIMQRAHLHDRPTRKTCSALLAAVEDLKNVYIVDSGLCSDVVSEIETLMEQSDPQKVFLCGINTDLTTYRMIENMFTQPHTTLVLEDLCSNTRGTKSLLSCLAAIRKNVGIEHVCSSDDLSVLTKMI